MRVEFGKCGDDILYEKSPIRGVTGYGVVIWQERRYHLGDIVSRS